MKKQDRMASMNQELMTLDFWQDTVIYEGKTFPVGTLACDALNVPADTIAKMNEQCEKINLLLGMLNAGQNASTLFPMARDAALAMLDILSQTPPFSYMNISQHRERIEKVFTADNALKYVEYATYIFQFIRDTMLRFRMGEEKWSVSSLTNYKMVRSMAWLYLNTKDAVSEFSKKYNCDLALAEEYLKVVRGIRNQQPFYVTDEDGEETGEDVALDDTWNYTDILWNGIQAEKVQRAFEKLNYREQTLLEKRLAVCMTCGRVGSWKNRPTFEELAVMFEGSTASGAERAYRKAVDKLTERLVAEGALHAVRLKQKSKTKRKKKIATAIYEYQADCDGEWGEISLDFENGTAEIARLADWDTMKTNRFANKAITYLLSCENEKPPKETMVAFNL